MVVANLHLQEVRESQVEYRTVETKNPTDARTAEAGEQQVEDVPPSVLSRIGDVARGAYERFEQGGIFQ